MKQTIDSLAAGRRLTRAEFEALLGARRDASVADYLLQTAGGAARSRFGSRVYARALVEVTNLCQNNCFYCGIRSANRSVQRYCLTREQVLECCETGYRLGFRTFVLQGGEGPACSAGHMLPLIEQLHRQYPDCAITLSFGEMSARDYRALFQAGATRYLLRHETADEQHYRQLHPASMSLHNRKQCLWTLKEIGYQTGAGFMVGSPGQTDAHLAQDMVFLQELQPQMVGIGPFIPHPDTPFGSCPAGSLEDTLFCLALVRLILPNANLPATTALGSIHPNGRELGLAAGANVVMPNLTPPRFREQYSLYQNKLSAGAEAAEGLALLRQTLESAGFSLCMERGDYGEPPKL